MSLDPTSARAAPLRYARWLSAGAKTGFVMMLAAFALYVLGVLPAHVPIERLPELWNLPAAEYLAASGQPGGWGWLPLATRADLMNLVGVAVLASCSIPCLLAVIPDFRARRERVFVVICILEVLVLLLAASGFVAGGH